MDSKILKIFYIIIIIFFFVFQPFPLSAQEPCETKYPDDGQCKAACEEGESHDDTAGLCATGKCCHRFAQPAFLKLQVPLFEYTEAGDIAEYISKIYNVSFFIAVPIAIVITIFAGAGWILSGGNPDKIKKSKNLIIRSFIGLGLILSSYIILSFFGLTAFGTLQIEYIEGLPDFSDYEELLEDIEQTPPPPYRPGARQGITTARCETLSGIKNVRVDASIKEILEKTCREVKAINFNIKGIGGLRPGSKFCHGKGLAVDINVPQNYCIDCYRKKGAKVGKFFKPGEDPLSLTRAVVNIFYNNGWCWGGDWRSFKDYMHFSHSCSRAECAAPRPYNWNLSVQENHKRLGITWP